MKKFILAALLVCSSAFADEVTVMDEGLPGIGQYYTTVDARFHMDQATGEGFVKVYVTEERPGLGGHYDSNGRWYPNRMPMPVTIFSETVKVDGLMLMGDRVMFHSPEGDVDCGKMGVSRVFKRPTIYLNGNCSLSGELKGRWSNSRVVVTLKTK